MNRLNGTDLAALHQAITTVSAAAFPGVHFEFYREDRVNLPMGTGLPGADPKAYALLELAEMDAADMDPGTDQQAVVARFEAQIVMKALRADAKVEIRSLAGSFAAFLRKQSRFNPSQVLQGSARVVGCYKDDFSPELDQFEVWRVEWTQEIWLGSGVSVWTKPAAPGGLPELMPATNATDLSPALAAIPALDAVPSQQLFSYVPMVGIPHEPDYTEMDAAPGA